MIDVINSNIGTKTKVEAKLFTFIDNDVAMEYSSLLTKIENDPCGLILKKENSYDLNGVLSVFIEYKISDSLVGETDYLENNNE